MTINEIEFGLSDSMLHRAETVLFPAHDPGGEHGFIGIATPSSGRKRRTVLLQRIVDPLAGEVTFGSEGLLFAANYKSRATDLAAQLGGGLLFVHSHPLGNGIPKPSKYDLDSDARDLFFLGGSLPPCVPLVAGIVSGGRRWSVREYTFGKRGLKAPASRDVHAMRVVGPGVRKMSLLRTPTLSAHVAERAQDSSIRLWGRQGQEILACLRVGIVGLGGVGSILAEHVARLGVGRLVLFDFDFLTIENANRQQGATPSEIKAGRLKLDVAARVAKMSATAPAFEVTKVFGSIVEEKTCDALMDCDVILNAADSPWARQVLDHVAFAHLIPVINGGTELSANPTTARLIAGKCEVAVSGPGHPCFECADVYTRQSASEAREHPDVRGKRGYLQLGDQPLAERSPSVISTNAVVAGLMQLRFQALTLGTTPNAAVGTQRYHLMDGVADYELRRACQPDCPRVEMTALGDTHQLPLGMDRDFEVVADRLAAAEAQKAKGIVGSMWSWLAPHREPTVHSTTASTGG